MASHGSGLQDFFGAYSYEESHHFRYIQLAAGAKTLDHFLLAIINKNVDEGIKIAKLWLKNVAINLYYVHRRLPAFKKGANLNLIWCTLPNICFLSVSQVNDILRVRQCCFGSAWLICEEKRFLLITCKMAPNKKFMKCKSPHSWSQFIKNNAAVIDLMPNIPTGLEPI